MGSPDSEVMLVSSPSNSTACVAEIVQSHKPSKSDNEARTHKVTFDSDSIQPSSTSYGRKDETSNIEKVHLDLASIVLPRRSQMNMDPIGLNQG